MENTSKPMNTLDPAQNTEIVTVRIIFEALQQPAFLFTFDRGMVLGGMAFTAI